MWSQFPPSVEIKWNENLLLIYRQEQKCSDIYCTWHLIHSQHRHCPLFLRHLLSPKERERAILSCRHCISQAHICWGTRGHRTGISPLKRTNNSPVLLLGNFFWDKTSATESNSHRAWRCLCSRKLPHPKLALNKQNPPWTTRSVGFFFIPNSKKTRDHLGGDSKAWEIPGETWTAIWISHLGDWLLGWDTSELNRK